MFLLAFAYMLQTPATTSETALTVEDAIASPYPPVIQTGDGQVNAIALDGNGNRYVAGFFTGTHDFNPTEFLDAKGSAGGLDAYITRFNADGSYGWTQTFGGTKNDAALDVFVLNECVYAVGYFASTDAGIGGAGSVSTLGLYDAFVLALDASTGAPKTSFSTDGIQTFGGAGYDEGQRIVASDGALYVAGEFQSLNAGIGGPGTLSAINENYDVFVLALDPSTGDPLTSFSNDGVQTFAGSDFEECRGIAVSDSTVYLSGFFNSTDAGIGAAGNIASQGNHDAFIVALDGTSGSPVLGFGQGGVQTFGGSETDDGGGLALSDGKVFMVGFFSSTNAGIGGSGTFSAENFDRDGFVIALDALTGIGDPNFGDNGVQVFAGSTTEELQDIAVWDGKLYATGFFYSLNAGIGGLGSISSLGNADACVLALDCTDGSAISSFGVGGIQTFGGSAGDLARRIATWSGLVFVAGDFNSVNAGLGSTGTASSTGFHGFLLTLGPQGGAAQNGLVTLGNLVFSDLDNDGSFNPGEGEAGIDGVIVNLYRDSGLGEGTFDSEDLFIATTTTVDGGQYSFLGLDDGDYIVRLAPANFAEGGVLHGYSRDNARGATSDPDDDIDSDDNGDPDAMGGVSTRAVTLTAGIEPDLEVDGDDTQGNLTVDFGLVPAPVAIDDEFTTNEDVPVSGFLCTTNPLAWSLTFQILTGASKGAIEITDPATGHFTYTPDLNISGQDTFTFAVIYGSVYSNTATITVTIDSVNDKPVAIIFGSDPFYVEENVALSFDGTGADVEDGTNVAYDWDWDDGSANGSAQNPSHVWDAPGTYTVTLIVTDQDGLSSDPVTVQVIVTPKAGERDLFLKRGKFMINWKSHNDGVDKDSFSVQGYLNPAGCNALLNGATFELSVNGVSLGVVPLASNGKGSTGNAKASLKAKTGAFSFSIKDADLRTALGLSNTTEAGDLELGVEISVQNAGLYTDTFMAHAQFDYTTTQDATSKGSFNFKIADSADGYFFAAKTTVTEDKTGAHKVSVKGYFDAPGGASLVPAGNATLTIGGKSIAIASASLTVSGGVIILTKGAHPDLAKFILDTNKELFTIQTNALAGAGVPPVGNPATSLDLLIRIEIPTAGDLVTFETTVEILRSSPTSKVWKR